MTVSTENPPAPAPVLEPVNERRAGRELVLEVIFRPLASALVPVLLRARVPPPAVVLANATAGLCAAIALARGELVLAALLLQLKTLLDNADGRLARASGRVTLAGRYLDTEADLVVNAALFAALGSVTGQQLLALVAFLALTFVLAVDFNVSELHRAAHGIATQQPPALGGRLEGILVQVYQGVFAPQDRLIGAVSARRLERLLGHDDAAEPRAAATLAFHERSTVTVLANLGLSTQLAVLGLFLILGVPEAYLWFALGCLVLIPLLQLRRERLGRRALAR